MLKSIDPSQKDKFFDILIIGSGPGGLTASIYAARAELRVAFIEGNTPGGKVTTTSKIENYPGFSQINGADLALNMLNQATNLKAQYIYGWVTNIIKDEENNLFCVTTKEGQTYFSKVVIVATGMKERKLGLPREKEFEGHGISYCAVCDGFLYKSQDVAVLGSGEYAIHEAQELANVAKSVTILTNGKSNIKLQESLKDKIIINEKQIKEFIGDKIIRKVKFTDDTELQIRGIFVAEGVATSIDFARKLGARIAQNRIVVDSKMETNLSSQKAKERKKEIGLLEAVLPDGNGVAIIRDGRFVLKGCEELNKPFL